MTFLEVRLSWLRLWHCHTCSPPFPCFPAVNILLESKMMIFAPAHLRVYVNDVLLEVCNHVGASDEFSGRP